MSDSAAIDQAVMDKLLTDAPLRALLPDGVFWDEAGPSMLDGGNSQRFVLISLVTADDEPAFRATAFEDVLYAIKAMTLSTAGGNIVAAAARIQTLLHFGTLTIPGYGLMVMRRRQRLRRTETDAVDNSIRWQHRGGHYQVMAAPVGT